MPRVLEPFDNDLTCFKGTVSKTLEGSIACATEAVAKLESTEPLNRWDRLLRGEFEARRRKF
jgi:hypothetical protein